MYAIELYVPKFDNDGQEINQEHWTSLESQIIDLFYGFTCYATVGRYKDFSEEMITVYRILSPSFVPGDRRQIEEIAQYVKEHWRQESVLWTLTEMAEINFN